MPLYVFAATVLLLVTWATFCLYIHRRTLEWQEALDEREVAWEAISDERDRVRARLVNLTEALREIVNISTDASKMVGRAMEALHQAEPFPVHEPKPPSPVFDHETEQKELVSCS